MIYIVWQFKPKPEKREEFEQAYCAHGEWAKLFRSDPAYRETRLARDLWRKDVYLCIDLWRDVDSYENFKKLYKSDYEKLDRECDALIEEEIAIGIFEDL